MITTKKNINAMVFLFIAALTSTLNYSCNKDSQARIAENEEGIWPLKLNNEWTFSFTVYNENGTVKEQSSHSFKVLSDTLAYGNKFYKIAPDFFVRNYDVNTVDAFGASKIIIPYLKKSNIDNNKYFTTTVNLSGCTAATDYVAYSGVLNIGGHDCHKNEEIYRDCAGGIRTKIVKYFKVGVGIVLTERYNKSSTTGQLYLATKELLQNFHLN